MSTAAAQASKFYEQVVRDGRVFTFVEDGGMLIYPVRDIEVVPFWSSRTRLVTVRKNHPKYQAYKIDEIALPAFLNETLPQLADEGIHVGVNWSGKRLTGYDQSVDALMTNIVYWQRKFGDDD